MLLEPNDATAMLVGAVWPLLPTLHRCTADRERRRSARTSTARSWKTSTVMLEPNDATVMLVGAVWLLLPTLHRCTADRGRLRSARTSTTRGWYRARCCPGPATPP